MSRTHIQLIITLLAAATMAHPAAGQCADGQEYQIFYLGDAPTPTCDPGQPDQRWVLPWGINNSGAIVGQVVCNVGYDVDSRAFLWVPQPMHGLGTTAFVYLEHLGDPYSGAEVINDAGIVVGWQGENAEPLAEQTMAVVWKDLMTGSEPDLTPVAVPTTESSDEPWMATSINNQSPASVVGSFEKIILDGEDWDFGFVWTIGDEYSTALPPIAEWVTSGGLSINDQGLIGGFSYFDPSAQSGLQCGQHVGDATWWEGETGGSLPQGDFLTLWGDPAVWDQLDGEARGTNNTGNLAGMGVQCMPNNQRRNRALHWTSKDADDATYLNYLVEALEGNDAYTQSEANALNLPVLSASVSPVVVGWNFDDEEAVIWRADPDPQIPWCVKRLDEAIGNAISEGPWDELMQATDINDAGWIVGYGSYEVDPNEFLRVRGFLLIPVPSQFGGCCGDTDADGVVDRDDLVNVLTDWGTDGTGNGGDVDGSGVVDTMDEVAVVLNWGLCPDETGSEPDSLQAVIQGVGMSWPGNWERFAENLDDENYRCWMVHFLTDNCHPLCPTCLDPLDCPGGDPWRYHF